MVSYSTSPLLVAPQHLVQVCLDTDGNLTVYLPTWFISLFHSVASAVDFPIYFSWLVRGKLAQCIVLLFVWAHPFSVACLHLDGNSIHVVPSCGCQKNLVASCRHSDWILLAWCPRPSLLWANRRTVFDLSAGAVFVPPVHSSERPIIMVLSLHGCHVSPLLEIL